MGLEEVKQDILKKSRDEIIQVDEETKKAVKIIEQEADREIKENTKQKNEAAKKELERLRQIKEAEAEGEAMNLILQKKAEMIGRAIKDAEKFIKKDSENYLKKIMAKAKKELDVDRVYCSKDNAQLIKEDNIVISDVDGIIVENKDGSVSIDYSFGSLLSEIKEKNLQNISKVLFK